jgi:hypothetical protein
VPTQGQAGADPWLELEDIVDRLARLVLHAHSLSERRAEAHAGDAPGSPADERGRRLLAGVDLGRRALAAAARVEVLAQSGPGRQAGPSTAGTAPSWSPGA